MLHGKHARGFEKLRPHKTEEEEKAEQVLRDYEAGKYGPPVKEEEKPKPAAPPVEEDKDIAAEKKRRRAIRKAMGLPEQEE